MPSAEPAARRVASRGVAQLPDARVLAAAVHPLTAVRSFARLAVPALGGVRGGRLAMVERVSLRVVSSLPLGGDIPQNGATMLRVAATAPRQTRERYPLRPPKGYDPARMFSATDAASRLHVSTPTTVKNRAKAGKIAALWNATQHRAEFYITEEMEAQHLDADAEAEHEWLRGLDVNVLLAESLDREVRARSAEDCLQRMTAFYEDQIRRLQSA